MRGFFITFEGIDGAGKTTQQHLAAQALREQGYDVLESREPGGTQLAEKVRALVLDPELPLTTATQTLLYQMANGTVAAVTPAPSTSGTTNVSGGTTY